MKSLRALGRHTFSSLSIRNYRLYFIGQGISLSGTWMQSVALGWLVLQLTKSGSQLGFIVALQFVPMLFFGPWGGVIADRFDKRRLLFWTQGIAGVLAGVLSFLIYFNLIQLWMIYLLALLLGIVRVFDIPTRQTFVSEMVGSDHIKNAVSLNATENNLARAVGPTIGGILIATMGIAFCFLFNAISYIAVIIMLKLIREKELYPAVRSSKKSGQLMEGFRYIRATPVIRNILLMMAVIGTFAYEFQVSLPLLAQQTFHGGAAGYAALMTAFGLGAVIGGLFAAGRHKIAPHHHLVFCVLFGVSIIAASMAPTLPLAIVGMAIVGVFSINVTSLGNTMIQMESKPEMRGRVMALEFRQLKTVSN